MKLSETYGLEEADKFTELLRQVPLLANNAKPNHIDALFNGFGDSSKNYSQLMESQHPQQPKPEHKLDHLLKMAPSTSYNETVANKLFQSDELDSIFMSSLQNQKSNAKENEKSMSEQMYQQPSMSTNMNFSDRNILNGIDLFNMSSKPLDLELEPNAQSPQHSVPLYMRKAHNRNFE